jgi:hypothetical protein
MRASVVVIAIALARVAAADTIQIDGEVMAGPIVWLGGSVHAEHRLAGSRFGLTLRGGVTPGGYLGDDGNAGFVRFTGVVGARMHWGPQFYGELAAGVQALRSGRYVDDYDRRYGITYDVYPAGELAVGARFGPVDVSLFTPGFGLGLRVGGAFDP